MANMHNVYMYCGSIFDMNDCIIENPALIIDKSSGCIHGWGNYDSVNAKFIKMTEAYRKSGMPEMADDLLLMDFSNAYGNGMTNEQVCYILRRAAEYTATSFKTQLVEHATKSDFIEWLNGCMEKLPLDLLEKEWK